MPQVALCAYSNAIVVIFMTIGFLREMWYNELIV